MLARLKIFVSLKKRKKEKSDIIVKQSNEHKKTKLRELNSIYKVEKMIDTFKVMKIYSHIFILFRSCVGGGSNDRSSGRQPHYAHVDDHRQKLRCTDGHSR